MAKELIQKAKGMHDILPREYKQLKNFFEKATTIAEFYGFKPIQTPYLEKVELFSHSAGENTDLVEKEMYSLKTKGGDKLVLRPEGTAPIMRAYLEYGLHTKPQPIMFYYHGSFFRHEKPQKGRTREHQQFGLEVLGETDPILDAIIIKTMLTILEEAAGLKNITVHLNSIGDKECRKEYIKELTAYYRKQASKLCSNCHNRLKTNPLRLLDCKNEKCAELKADAPQIIDFLCDGCAKNFKELLEILEASEIPYYIDHYLVRGLDYYSCTVFEFFKEDNEEKLALAGGGRYDTLGSLVGGKNVPGVGVATSVERALGLTEQKQKIVPKTKKVFLIQLGIGAKNKAILILEILRKAKIPTGHSLSKHGLKGQLKIAAKMQTEYALIFGQKEAMENTIIVKNMKNFSQETVPLDQLINYLKKKG